MIPSKIDFFASEAFWGKVITLDQLKCHGRALANGCCLCEEDEETTRMLWDLVLTIVGTSWVFLCSVLRTLLAWQGVPVGKNEKKIWMAAPLRLFWTLWREINRVVFDNGVTNAHKTKSNFLNNLWTWANLHSVDNMNS